MDRIRIVDVVGPVGVGFGGRRGGECAMGVDWVRRRRR